MIFVDWSMVMAVLLVSSIVVIAVCWVTLKGGAICGVSPLIWNVDWINSVFCRKLVLFHA